MATLRNKSTDEGTIIRWTPHPEHSRPSTYQVTSDAVEFLASLGYSVPHAGDESEIPWEICRALRALGDLYFKSENPGEVTFDSADEQADSSLVALSDDQRDALVEYIEQHPNHTEELHSELMDETGTTTGDDTGGTSVKRQLETQGEKPVKARSGIIPHKHVQIGRIHRFSSSNNAMIDPIGGDGEQNIGKIPKYFEGEWTINARYGSMGICLTPQLWSSDYRNQFRKHIDELERRIDITPLRGLLGIEQRSSPAKIDYDSTSVYILVSGFRFGIGYKGPWTVVVLSNLVTHGGEVVVEITDEYGKVLIGKPTTKSIASTVSTGDEIVVDVVRVGHNRIIGSYRSNYVEIPRTSANPCSKIKISVTDVRSDRIRGTVSDLSEESRPSVGDEISLVDGEAPEYPHLPIIVPDSLPATVMELRLGVAEVLSDGIRVSVASRGEHAPVVKNQVLTETYSKVESEPYLSIQNGFPIQIEGVRHLPGHPIDFRVTEFTEGFVAAIFTGASTTEPVIREYSEHVQSGINYFAQGQITEATEQFIYAIEVATTAEENALAQALEIYSLSRKLLEEADIDEAISFCKTRLTLWTQESGLENSPFHSDVQAIEPVLSALNSTIKLERTDDREEQVILRRELKDKLSVAVNRLSNGAWQSASYDMEPLMGWINEIIIESADRLILVPDPVEEYIENAHSVDTIVVYEQDSRSEEPSQLEDHNNISEDYEETQRNPVEPESPTELSNDGLPETKESHNLDETPDSSSTGNTQTDQQSQNLVEAWEAAVNAATSGKTETVTSAPQSSYSRSKAVQKFARLRADGYCEYCGKEAVFVSKTGEPYLEVHHIDELSDGGADHPSRVAALCPTCHSEIHYGEYGDLLNKRVDKILSIYLADTGRSAEQ